MSLQSPADTTPTTTTTSRPVGTTEHSWCRAVPGGTGVTVSALLLSKPPDLPHLQSCLQKLQSHHPILQSNLHFNPTTTQFTFTTPTNPPPIQIQTSTSPTDSFHSAIEHAMGTNPWQNNSNHNNHYNHNNNNNNDHLTETETDVMFASVYSLVDQQWVVVLKLHTAVCDRVATGFLLRELVGLMGGGVGREIVKEEGLGLAIEECVPAGKGNKPFWARGMDVIGYSVNAFRFSNLEFKESGFPSSTQLVRVKVGVEDTDRILSGCKAKGVKLFGLLAAAGFIAARASKDLPDEKWEKYSLATLIDCHSLLDPVRSEHHIGFYHSAILNSHDVKGGEDLWDLAQRICTSLATAKDKNKHFTDMADLSFLMCKAIDNPGLTPSSSLRTSLLSVFEETITENTNEFHEEIGLLDHISCASVHGVSPSLAIFDSIRDGELDCACVYPSPTHSREQMQGFVDHMKKIIVENSLP